VEAGSPSGNATKQRLAALMLAAAIGAVSPAPAAPVWEPGDPLPDMAPDATIEVMPATQTPTPMSRPARATARDETDFLCTRAPAGTTAPVPPPFDGWLVRVCAPAGQALVPVNGEAWVAHGSADPISILALVPGATPPGGAGFDPRYDIRFSEFAGVQASDARRARADALLAAATANGRRPPAYDAVWQLDAQSNIAPPGTTEAARYNIFFYVDGERPRNIIACLDECRQALYLDVLSGDEARDVLQR